jgi:serine/threonine protein kinase
MGAYHWNNRRIQSRANIGRDSGRSGGQNFYLAVRTQGGRTVYRYFGPCESRLGSTPLFRSLRRFYQGITEHRLKPAEKQAFFVALRRLAGSHGRLPDSVILTERVEASDKILTSGGFADVRSGRYMGRLVAVKTLRVTEQDDLLRIRKVSTNDIHSANRRTGQTVLFQQFCKEVILWSTLSHPNVLKLAGVQGDMKKGQFSTVSEWMAHGNIMEYTRNNHVNRLDLVRDFTFPATSFVKMRQ